MWIARFNTSNNLIPPAASVAPGVTSSVAAQAMGWSNGTWREITNEEVATLQAPTISEQIKHLRYLTRQYLDDFAKTRDYDDILNAASYSCDLDPQYEAEGIYARDSRSSVWKAVYTILNQIESEEISCPSDEEFLAELPVLTWPEVEEPDPETIQPRQ